MDLDRRVRLLLVLSSVFVVCLIVGDLIGGKLVEFTLAGVPVTVSVGMIPFPVTFLLTDTLNEFYGHRVARWVTWVGLGMALLTYLFLFAAGAAPIAEVTKGAAWSGVTEEAYSRVFMSSQRIIIGSMVAYTLGQLLDIAVFRALKSRTGGRYLWVRATGSTVVSQLVDTAAISAFVWGGQLPLGALLSVVFSSYLVKLVAALALTPLVYAGHAVVERVVGLEPVMLR